MHGSVRLFLRLLTLGAAAFAGGCTTVTMTQPPETATEQLLITTAIDNAVANMTVAIPAGTRIYFDGSFFDGLDRDQKVLFPKYAMAAIREKLLQGGALLAEDRQSADMIVEARTGGQSIDHNALFVGIPSFSVPLPPSFVPVATPELAFYKRDRQTGVAKLAIVAYRQDNGAYAASSGSSFGSSNHTETTLLLVIDRITSDIEPKVLQARTH